MRCPNCGQRLADEARKCPVCGTVIDEVVRINIPEKQAEETKISYAGRMYPGNLPERRNIIALRRRMIRR